MCVVCNAAEEWLNPSFVIEAFEARAARLTVACATNINEAPNPEEGIYLFFSVVLVTSSCYFSNNCALCVFLYSL